MNKEELIEWLEVQIKIAESSAEISIQELEGDGEEQFGMIKAFKEVIEYLNSKVITKVNLHEVSLLSDGSHGIGGKVGPKQTGSDDVDYNFKG